MERPLDCDLTRDPEIFFFRYSGKFVRLKMGQEYHFDVNFGSWLKKKTEKQSTNRVYTLQLTLRIAISGETVFHFT